MQEITVGQEKFPFSAHQISRQQDSVSLQDIVRVPLGSGEACTEVAQVAQRLHIQVQTYLHQFTAVSHSQQSRTVPKRRYLHGSCPPTTSRY